MKFQTLNEAWEAMKAANTNSQWNKKRRKYHVCEYQSVLSDKKFYKVEFSY